MKQILVPFIDTSGMEENALHYNGVLDLLAKNKLDHICWPLYPYKPDVHFVIAYTTTCIHLKYYVSEKAIRAINTMSNSPVYEDSCVEFFIAFDDRGYYNFEFNCLGTCLAAYGPDRENRVFIQNKLIENIWFQLSMCKRENKLFQWELLLKLPLSVFEHHKIGSLKGKSCRANFYKCGDLLPEPHYVSWTEIKSVSPDFHLPAYFGKLTFE